MDKEMIPVFFGTDENYAVPTYVAIYSIIRNHHEEEELTFFVLVSNDFSEKYIDLFQSLSSNNPKVSIQTINVGEVFDSVAINHPRITKPTLYRLLIPDLISRIHPRIDKCIYLDQDLVVEGDISSLYQIDIEDYYVGGVLERYFTDEMLNSIKNELGIPSISRYINAGVLLMNIKLIREDGINRKWAEAGSKNVYSNNDEDIINQICYDRIKVLPLKYNVNSIFNSSGKDTYDQYDRNETREAEKNPVIIHYSAWRKPWSFRYMPFAWKWWKYIQMQDHEIMEKYIELFLKEKKASLYQLARTFVKTVELMIYRRL